MKEIWKDIAGYEGIYKVSNFGKVESQARIKSAGKNKKTYLTKKILYGNI